MISPFIERLPRAQQFGTPLLLAPGAFCGTWVWEDRFLDAFAEAGFRSYAMQFRGHGGSWLGRQRFGLEDYVDDLEAAISRLPARPVLIAHSLGALAAVRLLTRIALPGAVLMAPVPPDGVQRSMLRLEWESTRALLESLVPVRLNDRLRSTPIHVIGAEGDAVIAPTDVRRCARLLGASVEVLPGRSHMLMAEPGWQQITKSIVRWIKSTTGRRSSREPVSRRPLQRWASA